MGKTNFEDKTKWYPYNTNTESDNKDEALSVQAPPVTIKINAKWNHILISISKEQNQRRNSIHTSISSDENVKQTCILTVTSSDDEIESKAKPCLRIGI